MKISIFTVSTPEYNVDETIAFAKEIGCDGLEWRVSDPPPAAKPENYTFEKRYWSFNRSTLDIDKIETELPVAVDKTRAAGLEVLGATTYLRLSHAPASAIERALTVSGQCGLAYMRTPAPGYDRSVPYSKLFDATRAAIEEVLPHAEKTGVRICLEMHMNTVIPSASSARRLLEGLDPRLVGIIYDPGNLVIEGYEDYQMGLEILGEYLGYVHVKNATWIHDPEREAFAWNWDWAPLDSGMADFRDVLASLKTIGYDHWLSIEDFSNEQPTREKLSGIVARLKELIREAQS